MEKKKIQDVQCVIREVGGFTGPNDGEFQGINLKGGGGDLLKEEVIRRGGKSRRRSIGKKERGGLTKTL